MTSQYNQWVLRQSANVYWIIKVFKKVCCFICLTAACEEERVLSKGRQRSCLLSGGRQGVACVESGETRQSPTHLVSLVLFAPNCVFLYLRLRGEGLNGQGRLKLRQVERGREQLLDCLLLGECC
jgi:hypothetical protein